MISRRTFPNLVQDRRTVPLFPLALPRRKIDAPYNQRWQFRLRPGAPPGEGTAAPSLVGGVRVSKGRGESKRLALLRAFGSFPRAGKGIARPGRAAPEETRFAKYSNRNPPSAGKAGWPRLSVVLSLQFRASYLPCWAKVPTEKMGVAFGLLKRKQVYRTPQKKNFSPLCHKMWKFFALFDGILRKTPAFAGFKGEKSPHSLLYCGKMPFCPRPPRGVFR